MRPILEGLDLDELAGEPAIPLSPMPPDEEAAACALPPGGESHAPHEVDLERLLYDPEYRQAVRNTLRPDE